MSPKTIGNTRAVRSVRWYFFDVYFIFFNSVGQSSAYKKENIMKLIKCIITTITFAFAAQQLVAGGHGDGHPILTPLEPKAMEGAYTAMLMGEDTFKANSSFDWIEFRSVRFSFER